MRKPTETNFVSYYELLSKKHSEYKTNFKPKEWIKKMKALLKDSLTEKLKDYKPNFLKLLKSCDETNSMGFLRSVQWIDRFQSESQPKCEVSALRRSKIVLPSLEPSMISFPSEKSNIESTQTKLFKKLLLTIAHQIKFGKNFYTQIIECFTKAFVEKYSIDLISTSPEFETRKMSTKEPFSFLSAGSFPWSFSKKPSLNLQNMTKITSSPVDYQACIKTASEEIKDFRRILILLLTELIKTLDNFSDLEWTSSDKRLLFETVNRIIFTWNDQLYYCMMKLISLALAEKQEEFTKRAAWMKNWSTKEFQIHPNFCMQGTPHPFLSAIETMNMLGQHFTPEDKFKTVCATRTELVKAIDDYWDAKDPNKASSELIINADELLPLYTYIVSRSNGSKLLCEIYFIEQFLDQHTLYFSENSYFFATVNAAMNYVLSLAK